MAPSNGATIPVALEKSATARPDAGQQGNTGHFYSLLFTSSERQRAVWCCEILQYYRLVLPSIFHQASVKFLHTLFGQESANEINFYYLLCY